MKKIFFLILLLGWLTPKSGIGQSFIPDTTVNHLLKLDDYESIEKFLGDVMDKTDSNAPLPDIYFTNKFSFQYLRLVFFPGGTKNSFPRFEIGIKPTSKKYTVLKQYSSFRTESNIGIGSSLNFVLAVKGNSYKKKNIGSVTVISYELNNLSQSPLLLKHNMPSYTAEYYFKKGKLIKMSYGFEYP